MRQSNTISSPDDDLFGRYLDNTGGLANHSSDALQSFFDGLDRILEDSEAFVTSSLASFFDIVAERIGLSPEGAVTLEAMVFDEVAAFFDDIDHFVSEAYTAFMEPAEPTVPVEAPTPSREIDQEADPAALLI